MTRKEFLAQYQTKEWYELSRQIKARDHNTCQMCGRNDVPLSVHHLKYGEDGSLFVNDDCLITLCDRCHKINHEYKKNIPEMIEDLREHLTDYEIGAYLYSILLRMEFNYDGISVLSDNIEDITTLEEPTEDDCKGYGTFYHNLRQHRYFLNLKYREDNGTERVYFQKEMAR